MKGYIGLICAAIICLSAMCGCGKEAPAEENTTPTVPTAPAAADVQEPEDTDDTLYPTEEQAALDAELYPTEEQAEVDNAENNAYQAIPAEKIAGTYWKSVRFEGEGCAEGGDEMPMGAWNVDMFLNEDGTGRLRSTYGASYHFDPECTWSYDEGTSRLLIELADGTETYFHGLFSRKGLCLDYHGNDLWFKQAPMPAAGGEYCLADLEGTWKLTEQEIEGYRFSAEEEGVHGSVSFFFLDPELNANYVWYDDFGNRSEIVDAIVMYQDEPLIEGAGNDMWSVQLIGEDESFKCYASVIDRETLIILTEQYDEEFEYPAVSVQYFTWEGTGAVG